jgi:cathepsin A (carboxypeptidase C)
MKSSLFLLASVSLLCSFASAAPYDDAQVVLNQTPLQGALEIGNGIKHSVLDYLEDSKKAILKGKVNMQKWIHAGKEYIKQDNLLCELFAWIICS